MPLAGCSERDPSGFSPDGDANHLPGSEATERTRAELAGAPPSLRAATLLAMQREAGQAYDLDLVREGVAGRAYEGELVTMGRVLRVDSEGAAIARDYDGEADLGLRLERAGCAGDPGAVGHAEPEAAQNQASFHHALLGGRRVQEWYLAGPLGLEQGFTVDQSWACAGELEFEVGVLRARVEAGRREGELQFVSGANGARYSYGELAAWDAKGRPLRARMEPREGGVRILVDATGATYPVLVDPLVWAQQSKLVANDAAGDDMFGISVAIDGDTALVGAYLDSYEGGPNGGSAYVFVRSGSAWTQQAKLTAGEPPTYHQLGRSVALSGDTALVGAPYDDLGAGAATGSAYVFVRSGATWTEQAKLTASDGAPTDWFGHSVALDGDTALVGAYHDDHAGGPDAGSAYVFVRNGTTWIEQAKLTASDAGVADSFGWSVALSGNTALIGAFFDDYPTNDGFDVDVGSAYVFVRSGTNWAEQAKLTPSDSHPFQWFGFSVAVSGETALVGSPFGDSPGVPDGGSAYVFVRSGTTWTEEAKLWASDATTTQSFGQSVALWGDGAVVGLCLAEFDGAPDAGGAYRFVRDGGDWTQEAKLMASDAGVSDCFGFSVAVSEQTVLVGAPYDNPGDMFQTNAGSAYVFTLENKLELGDACSAGTECLSGFCADGVCCDDACTNGDCSAGQCVDLGAGGGGGSSGEGGSGVGGGGGAPTGVSDDSGCSCIVAGATRSGSAAQGYVCWALAVVAAMYLRRRRAA